MQPLRQLRSQLHLALVLLLVLSVPITANAQEAGWATGCDSAARPVIAQTTTAFDYAAACAVYDICMQTFEADSSLCQMQFAIDIIQQCAEDDAHCQTRALLYSAAVTVFDFPFIDVWPSDAPDFVHSQIPAILSRVEQGEFRQALADLQALKARYAHPMVSFSMGLLHTLLGENAAALTNYDETLAYYYRLIPAYYARGSLFASQGMTSRAALDFWMLHQFLSIDPALGAFSAVLVERYPFDAALNQSWIRYPVQQLDAGVVGQFVVDKTDQPAEPVTLAFYLDGELLLASNLSVLFRAYEQERFPEWLVLQRIGDQTYQFAWPELGEGPTGITLTFSAAAGEGIEEISFFEGYRSASFRLLPASLPDPRADLPGIRCPGAALSRLYAGGQAVSPSVNGTRFFDQPAGSLVDGLDGGHPPLDVIAGPLCQEGLAWFQVRLSDKRTFWTPESDATHTYQLDPVAPLPAGCEGAPVSRLTLGITAAVVAGLGSNNVRVEPASTSGLAGVLPAGARFEIIGGPVCGEGYTWWQVQSGNLTGWTAEGQGQTYWIAPAVF